MNDEDIIRLYFDRDEQAITETSTKYGGYCYTIANNILNNHEDSEECVLDTYQKTWETIPPQRPSVFSAFLGRITRNLSINRYKMNIAGKRGGNSYDAILEEISDVVSGSDTPEDIVMEQELVAAINEFLASLPSDKRKLFIRRYWYSDDIGILAKRFSISENNVSTSIRRLRIKLHDFLVERGFDL